MLSPTEIRRRRQLLTLTLDEAAARAGWTSPNRRQRWHDIESGRTVNPPVATAAQIAGALKCRVEDILEKS